MADRTQAPSGAGYALENRLIVSRTFPALYRDLRVQHVARFFATLRDSLMHFAPKGDGPTLTVLLTPGPYNETYFEHALLARYLGFPLVEGGDLTVRDGRVWLKTIGGLQARARDPAPPGRQLLRSARIAQRLGARRGRPDRLRAARQRADRQRARLRRARVRRAARLSAAPVASICSASRCSCRRSRPGGAASRRRSPTRSSTSSNLVFKPADPALRDSSRCSAQDLDEAGMAALRSKLAAQPERFVAQELVHVSQAPVLDARPRRPHRRARHRPARVRRRLARTATSSCPAA